MRIAIVVAAGAMLSGCNSMTAEQGMWLRESKRAYDRGQFSEAVRVASLFLDHAGGWPEAGRALYLRGLSRAHTGRRVAAYADLRAAAGQGDDADVAWHANFALGELNFEDGNWADAARRYAAAVAKMRAIPPMDRGLYRLAVATQRLGDWQESRRHFASLVSRFPQSGLAKSARRILRYAPNHFSLQCGAFSVAANADAFARQLSRDKLSATVRREVRDRRYLYIVYSGRYATYAAAQRGLANIREHVRDAAIWP